MSVEQEITNLEHQVEQERARLGRINRTRVACDNEAAACLARLNDARRQQAELSGHRPQKN